MRSDDVIDLREPSPVRLRPAPARPVGFDASADALLRSARLHAGRAEDLRLSLEREAAQRSAAVLALHVLYGCSVQTLAALLGVSVAEARAWVREGRHAELTAGG